LESLDDIVDKVAKDNDISRGILKKILDIERAHLYITQVNRNYALKIIRDEIKDAAIDETKNVVRK